jgi:hypothetical protein
MLNSLRSTGLVMVDLLTVHVLDKDLRCGYPSVILRKPIKSLDHRLQFSLRQSSRQDF